MKNNVVDVAVREETTKARNPKKNQTGHYDLRIGNREDGKLDKKIEVDPSTKL
jgi:hypothetical protein